jgi:hypothetical protein
MRPGGSPGFLSFRLSSFRGWALCALSGFRMALAVGWSSALFSGVLPAGRGVVGGWMVGLKRTALRRVCAALLCSVLLLTLLLSFL